MDDSAPRLSYKFQRLRERLREAIVSGELQGKLPGERTLAKRFGANAKTLGKALTDLAADGLLERTIGRGTFVREAGAPASDVTRVAPPAEDRWLCLCQADDPVPCAVALRAMHPNLRIVSDFALLRPSFLSHFTAVIDMHGAVPESVVRDMLLRGLRVIRYDGAPVLYATDAVMLDRAFSATLQARDLIRSGHHAIFAVDDASGELLESARAAVRRLEVDATVAPLAAEAIGGHGVVRAPDGGAPSGRAAYLCGSMATATRVRAALESAGVRIPDEASVAGVGLDEDDADGRACSGYAVTPAQVAATIVDLIAQSSARRPAPIWLVGSFVDRGTTKAISR